MGPSFFFEIFDKNFFFEFSDYFDWNSSGGIPIEII